MSRTMSDIRGFFFDLDGSVYSGEEIDPGVTDFFDTLFEQHIPFVFISNNSSQSGQEVCEKLERLGIEPKKYGITGDHMILPGIYAGEFLRERYEACCVYVCGSHVLRENVERYGFRLAKECDRQCRVVLLGRDTDFSWERLETAVRFIQSGADFVITNPDNFHPQASGIMSPETGALASAIRSVIPCDCTWIGKPGPFLFRKAIEKIGLDTSQLAIVGDNIWTDIGGGKACNLFTILIERPNQPRIPGDMTDFFFPAVPDLRIGSLAELQLKYMRRMEKSPATQEGAREKESDTDFY